MSHCWTIDNLRKGEQIYGKNKKRVQRTDSERSCWIQPEAGTDATDSRPLAAGTGVQSWRSDSRQVRGRKAYHHVGSGKGGGNGGGNGAGKGIYRGRNQKAGATVSEGEKGTAGKVRGGETERSS